MEVSQVGSRADLSDADSRADLSDAILMEASRQVARSSSRAESEVPSRELARFDSRSTIDDSLLHDLNSSMLDTSASSVASSPPLSPQTSSRRLSRDLSQQSHLMDSEVHLHPTPAPSEFSSLASSTYDSSTDASMHASLRHLEHYLHGPLASIPSARASEIELPERRLSLTKSKSPSPPKRHGVDKASSLPAGFQATAPPACSSTSTEKLQHLEAGQLKSEDCFSLLEEPSKEELGWGEESKTRRAV